MRQAGIIAAGALHAVEHHRARLADRPRPRPRLRRSGGRPAGRRHRPGAGGEQHRDLRARAPDRRGSRRPLLGAGACGCCCSAPTGSGPSSTSTCRRTAPSALPHCWARYCALVERLLLAAALAAALPPQALADTFACRGRDPAWELLGQGDQAMLTRDRTPGHRLLTGKSATLQAEGVVVWRGRSTDGQPDVVVTMLKGACTDPRAGDISGYLGIVSPSNGDPFVGCCSFGPQPVTTADASPPAPSAPPGTGRGNTGATASAGRVSGTGCGAASAAAGPRAAGRRRAGPRPGPGCPRRAAGTSSGAARAGGRCCAGQAGCRLQARLHRPRRCRPDLQRATARPARRARARGRHDPGRAGGRGARRRDARR